MAYYTSTFPESDLDGCPHTFYNSCYNFVQSESSISYPNYEFYTDNFYEYDQKPFFTAYEFDHFPPTTLPSISYSVSTTTEPKYIEYYANPYDGSYNGTLTQIKNSYSVSEFNDPEFEDYDPTPYDGGYDPAQTYGQPLSPSAEICYPRSSQDQNTYSINNTDFGSIPSPYGGEKKEEYEEIPQTKIKEKEPKHEEERSREGGRGYSPDRGLSEDEKRVVQYPHGYGLEAMDLCESLFGYWPCLNKIKKINECEQGGGEESYGNQWKGTADYLFGSSNPYGESGNYNGYERYYQRQPCYDQVEYYED